MNSFLFYILIFTFSFLEISAQKLNIQPQPHHFENLNDEIVIERSLFIIDLDKNKVEKNTINYLKHLISSKYNDIELVSWGNNNRSWSVDIRQISYENYFGNSQHYKIYFDDTKNIIVIESPSQLGLLYGVVSLSQLIIESKGKIKIRKAIIEDYPKYKRRLFVADPSAEDIPSLFDWALRNKLETVVIASRRHPWYEMSDDYYAILKEIKKWKEKFGGPKVMQSHNIYEGRDIVISDNNDVNALKEVIKVSYEHGIEKLMILSDDTPPYKFGEGYILTNDSDKKKFEHFEEANTYLMNELVDWFKSEDMEIESYYVPAFYTYEEMHQGDMELYKNTPWEEDAYRPFYRDLKYIGDNLNEDIYIIWCGPYVRSRTITKDDLDDWTKNLSGRIPFLWDNTIYSHYPFTSTSLLTAWNNSLPENFESMTAGNGMFINNDANSETGAVGTITTNDYLWNPNEYSPEKSLENAIKREYGENVSDLVLEFKDLELKIRRTLGERELWFESDSLWQQIRKVRYITQKNPFYYHLNYSRLKALRLQLKASVSEPVTKNEFIDTVSNLNSKREILLSEIKKVNISTYERLVKVIVPIPDFAFIK